MSFDVTTKSWVLNDKMLKLQAEKKASTELQERKHEGWDDNYLLYRNKVKTNRLTQRQPVNIPLMKETIKTMLSRIDDEPDVEWKENGGDQQKELYYQELWEKHKIDANLEIIDILDKKSVLLYGLGIKKLNIGKEGIDCDSLDIYDLLLDPLMNPWDTESARFFIQTNIFRSVRDVLADDRYTKEGKDKIKLWADSPEGITQSTENKEIWEEKMERLKEMGVEQSEFAYFAGGDRLLNLTEHFTRIWDEKKKEFVRHVVTYAEDTIELLDQTLEEALGVTFWPLVIWAEDPENMDVYPDSVADLIRVPNKVVNIWFSQLIENRTLKNFQMHWYKPDSNYTPQTYTPGPGVMLPAPPGDDINKVIKPVEISGLDDTLEAISIVTNIVERGTGATAIDKGQGESGQQTLGEIEILVGKSAERATSMAKFYRKAWEEYAKKWDALMHANSDKFKSMKVTKTNKNGKAFEKTLWAGDWVSEAGYKPLVRSTSEQETAETKGIQRFLFALQQFPNNIALRKIAQKRIMGILELTPEEMREIEEGEKDTERAVAEQTVESQALEKPNKPEAEEEEPQGNIMGTINKQLQELKTLA